MQFSLCAGFCHQNKTLPTEKDCHGRFKLLFPAGDVKQVSKSFDITYSVNY